MGACRVSDGEIEPYPGSSDSLVRILALTCADRQSFSVRRDL
jgi:hypothetical protein